MWASLRDHSTITLKQIALIHRWHIAQANARQVDSPVWGVRHCRQYNLATRRFLIDLAKALVLLVLPLIPSKITAVQRGCPDDPVPDRLIEYEWVMNIVALSSAEG